MLGLWLLAACAAEGPPPPPPDLGPPLLELVNQGTGDDRPLEQAMLHSAVDNYRGKDNLLLVGGLNRVSFQPLELALPEAMVSGRPWISASELTQALPVK